MRNYALGFGLLVALFACGGAAEPTTDPEPDAMPEESQPDSGTTVPTPDAAPTSISLRTLEPVDLKEVAGASATVAENLTVLTLSGTAATTASGLQVTINGEPVSMDSSGKWQKVVSFPPIDCNAEMTPNDLFIIEAKNSLGESVEQRIVVVRDPCPPRITWIPTEVQDESAWSVTFAGDAYVPCLRVPANPPTVVLDGVTPRTITKYLSNFYEEQAGNKTYFNASWVTGCQLLGSIPDEAGQNPFDLKWAIYDNIPGPVKLEVLLKAPGSSDFEPFLDETDQSEGGIVASKRTLRISEGNLEMVKKSRAPPTRSASAPPTVGATSLSSPTTRSR